MPPIHSCLVLCLTLTTASSSACGAESPSAAPQSGPAQPAVASPAPAQASDPLPAAASPSPQSQATRPQAAQSPVAPAASTSKPAAAQSGRAEPSRDRAEAMSVAELVSRKDLWPTRIAFVKEARLDPTTWWRAGEELAFHDFDGTNVILDEGTFLFDWPAEGTDVVKRVRDVAAALSPEALALTIDSLRQQPELWPVRVQTSKTLQFSNNTIVPAGREVALRFFEGDLVSVYDREVANYYTVEPHETDLMARSRALLEVPEAERQPFFVRSLAAALDAPDPAVAKRLSEADYVLVYAGRLGCGRCSEFLPQLKDVYARLRTAPPAAKFEVVFLPEDANAQSAQKYVAEAQPPGGALAFDRRLEAANLMTIPLQILPGLMVFDRNGTLIESNDPNGGSPSASDVLASFESRVKQPPR